MNNMRYKYIKSDNRKLQFTLNGSLNPELDTLSYFLGLNYLLTDFQLAAAKEVLIIRIVNEPNPGSSMFVVEA